MLSSGQTDGYNTKKEFLSKVLIVYLESAKFCVLLIHVPYQLCAVCAPTRPTCRASYFQGSRSLCALCPLVIHVTCALCVSTLHVSCVLRASMPHVSCPLHPLVPHLTLALRVFMLHVLCFLRSLLLHKLLSRFTCPSCFMLCVPCLSIASFMSFLPMPYTTFFIYFQFVSFFGKFTTVNLKVVLL